MSLEAFAEEPGTILSFMEIRPVEAQKYGIVLPGENGTVAGLVEKPKRGTAERSNLPMPSTPAPSKVGSAS